MTLAEILSIRPLQPDEIQILSHENTAVLDPFFNEGNFITLAASAVNTLVVSFTLPAGMLGILRAVAMQAPSPAQLDNIVWAVRFNKQPIHGLDRIRGPIGIGLLPLNVDMAMYDGWTVDIVASNNTAVAIPNVFAFVRGNFFNKSTRPNGS